MKTYLLIILSILMSFNLLGAPVTVRWTGAESQAQDFNDIIAKLNGQIGSSFTASDFIKIEDFNQANTHFRMYLQNKNGVLVKNHSIRIWVSLLTQQLLQVEALVDPTIKSSNSNSFTLRQVRTLLGSFSPDQSLKIARNIISSNSDDRIIKSYEWQNYWVKGKLQREVKAKGQYGYHLIVFDIQTKSVISKRYIHYPQTEESFLSLPARIYPIYEEPELMVGTILPRIDDQLKYIKTIITHVEEGVDPYAPLREKHYFYSKHDPVLAMTPNGEAQGYWSMTKLKKQAQEIKNNLPRIENGRDRIILDGKFATINIHPMAKESYDGIAFQMAPATHFFPRWQETSDGEDYEIIPGAAFQGRPFTDASDILNAPARRLPDHNPATYMNDGFDEIQVYWAINKFFDSLNQMGFHDPDFSTRPFHAFLYDPDISMKDNAFYTDDTINFTTYSPEAINYARDNSTIWHELGHGLMDRLMGDYLQLADTGGLSEGVADLTAQLIISDVMWGQSFPGDKQFRVINKTGFLLTNEVHDDGEAYGGAMNDMLQAAIKQNDQMGLYKFADLFLETMRLTRNHPELTAQEWFRHMLFADENQRPLLRQNGEFKDIILGALYNRNFSFGNERPAKVTIKVNDHFELTNESNGSRENPIRHRLKENETARYKLGITLTDGDNFQFHYPALVKVSFNGGPLQGAIHWAGEDRSDQLIQVAGPDQEIPISIAATGKCDFFNREDESCNDFVYIKVYNKDETDMPKAKYRFYLRVYPKK